MNKTYWKNSLRGLIGGATMSTLCTGGAVAQVSFEPLPSTDDRWGWYVLSPDGTPMRHQQTEESSELVLYVDGQSQEISPPDGFYLQEVFASGINANGERVIAATMDDTTNLWQSHNVIWIGDDIGILDDPGEGGSNVMGISDDGSTVVGEASAEYLPVVWRCIDTNCAGELLDVGFEFGYAADASRDGTVIGGSADQDGPYVAARWTLNTSTDEYDFEFLSTPDNIGDSWVNAVSADGNVLAGVMQAEGEDSDSAAQWRGDAEGTLLEDFGASDSRANGLNSDGSRIVGHADWRAILWDAEGNAAYISDILSDAGVNLGNLELDEATDISADGRTILGRGSEQVDGEDDESSQEVRSKSRFSYWLMYDESISTLEDLSASFASLGGATSFSNQLPHQNADLQAGLMGNGGSSDGDDGIPPALGYAPTQKTPEPIAAISSMERQDPQNWRMYGFVNGGTGHNQSELSANFGVGHLLHPDFMVGFGGGFRHVAADLASGSSADSALLSATAFSNYAPESGPQALISATFARLESEISRGYTNGATPVVSTGSTTGISYGVEARLGWRFAINDTIGLTPFLSYTGGQTDIAGYTETTGPMPATIDSFSDSYSIVRIGLSANRDIEGGHRVRGSVSWAHALDNSSTTVAGEIGAATVSGASQVGVADWFEAGAGLDLNLGDSWTLSTAINASLYDSELSGYAHAGLVKAF
jgi:uncharacterized protein YhjY with autotransporter beta-barrel domain